MRVPPVSFAGNWVEWNRQCRPLPTWLGSALACSLPGAELACDIGDAVCLGLSWRATSAMQSLVVRPLALVAPFLQELMGSGDQVLALVLFGEMEWQDMRAMHDLGGLGREREPFVARLSLGVFPNGCLQGLSDTRRANLAKTSSFWIHNSDMLPGRGIFPVRRPIWNTSSENLATDECLGKL